MSLPKKKKKTQKTTTTKSLNSLVKRALDNHTPSFHFNTTNHNPSKDEIFCSIIHFSTTLSLKKKKKDTKCFVEGLSEQTVEREKWRECSPDHLGLSKFLKNDMEFLKTKWKHQLTWDMALQSPTAILPSFFNFLFWRKKSWKGGIIRTTITTKMEQQPYAADLRLTERFSAPLWCLVSLYELVCASYWRELPILPKKNLLPSYYFSLISFSS